MAIQRMKVKWTGIRPCIQHNGRLADPLDAHTRKAQEITNKGSRKMVDDDYERLARIFWDGGLYYDKKLGPYWPSENIEGCIVAGAQKSRVGKDFKAALQVVEEKVRLNYDGPRDPDKMYDDPNGRFVMRKGVKVNNARIIRVRPMFPTGWSVTFTVEFDDAVIDRKSVLRAMEMAGIYIGLSDWRPKFGRFTVQAISMERR